MPWSVVPVGEEYGISYSYSVERHSLNLALTILPMAGDVELAIR